MNQDLESRGGLTLNLPAHYCPQDIGVDEFMRLVDRKGDADKHYQRLLGEFMASQLEVIFTANPDLEIIEIDGDTVDDFVPVIYTVCKNGSEVPPSMISSFEELMGTVAISTFEFLGAHSPIHRDTIERMRRRLRELPWDQLIDTDRIEREEKALKNKIHVGP